MPAKKICFVVWEASLGGVERQIHILSKEASQRGYAVDIVLLGKEGPAYAWWNEASPHIHVLDCAHLSEILFLKTLRSFFKNKKYDIVYVSSTVKILIVLHALKHTSVHIYTHVGNPVCLSLKQKTVCMLRWLLFGFHKHMTWVPCSKHVADSMKHSFFFTQNPILQSYNCIDIPKHPATLRTHTPVFHMGMVARFDPIKDHATVLETVALLRQKGFHTVCHFVGTGPTLPFMKQKAASLGISENIVWEGACDNISQHLTQWDACIFATTPKEGLGSAMAEAMAYGLPCVFSDAAPCKEVGGDCVLYAKAFNAHDFSEKMAWLITHAKERNAMGERARTRAEHLFSAQRAFTDLEKPSLPVSIQQPVFLDRSTHPFHIKTGFFK